MEVVLRAPIMRIAANFLKKFFEKYSHGLRRYLKSINVSSQLHSIEFLFIILQSKFKKFSVKEAYKVAFTRLLTIVKLTFE